MEHNMHQYANKHAPICKIIYKITVQGAYLSYYAYCNMHNRQNIQHNMHQYANIYASICKILLKIICKIIVQHAYLSYSAFLNI
jgi:hypothetical protein